MVDLKSTKSRPSHLLSGAHEAMREDGELNGIQLDAYAPIGFRADLVK